MDHFLFITFGSFEFFLKFAEMFASQGAPPVSTTTAAANLPYNLDAKKGMNIQSQQGRQHQW
jgi:hypothetical protein